MNLRRLSPVLAIAAAFLFSALVYQRLPERMPTHWNWQGEVDDYGGRLGSAFLFPLELLGIWGLLRVLPKIDPRRANYARFAGTYELVVGAIVVAGVVAHVLVLGRALGWPISLARTVPALGGVLLIVIGNVLPRARSNWWFGIRTPWTLSSERVWARTHRFAGYLMMAAGVALIAAAALPRAWVGGIAFGSIMAVALGSTVYSYLVWRKEGAA